MLRGEDLVRLKFSRTNYPALNHLWVLSNLSALVDKQDDTFLGSPNMHDAKNS